MHEHDPNFELRSLNVGDQTRSLLIYRPANLAVGPAPALLAFHGAGSCAEDMARFTNLTSSAERHGTLAVFLNGTGRVPYSRTWNAGPNTIHAVRHQIDDLSFVHAVIDLLVNSYDVDSTRIYAVGMSNGGLLAYQLAAQMPDRLAAVAVVGCSFLVGQFLQPSLPMPVIHFHGTDDRYVPFHGGVGDLSFTKAEFVSVQATVEFWANFNNCNFPAIVREASDSNVGMSEETQVVIGVYENDKNGCEVRLVTIQGGGHTWPGQVSPYPHLGRSTLVIDANRLIWEFHRRFQRN